MSLLSPPPGFPAHLAMVWPLIWVQILALRAYGRVFLRSIDYVPRQTEGPDWLKPALHENKRIAAALDGSLLTPAYARNPLIGAHPGERRGPVRQELRGQRLDPGFRRDERLSVSLPLPDS